MRIDNDKLRVTLVAFTIGTLLAMACGSSSESQPVPQALTAQSALSQETTAEVKIGNEIGNRLPDFELTLTSNGERLTSTSLVESGMPAFLFFFATT